MKNFVLPIRIALLLCCGCWLADAGAQGCDITVKMNGYPSDTLWLGRSVGKRCEPYFFAIKNAEGRFNLKSENALPAGLYALLFKRGPNADFEYINLWLAENQRQFYIETNFPRLVAEARVEGSPENECWFSYLSNYDKLKDSLNESTYNWKSLRTEPAFRHMVHWQETFKQYQESSIAGCAAAPMTAELLSQTLFVTPPAAAHQTDKNWQAEAADRYNWMRQHYFDRMDLGSGRFLQYPLWIDRADYFFARLAPPDPDSTIALVEEVFSRLQTDKPAYEYYFRYVLNSLSRTSRYRSDEAFTYFVRNYIEKGKADFLTADRREKFLDDAARMEPLFVGKKVPNATFSDKSGAPQALYDVKANYTLMAFWMYDCGHCKKEIPVLMEIYKRWQAKGLKVFSICGNTGEDKTIPCYEFAEQLGMPADWTVVNDPQRRTRFARLYNASSFPRIILLDAEKRVLFKHVGEVSEEVLNVEFERVIK